MAALRWPASGTGQSRPKQIRRTTMSNHNLFTLGADGAVVPAPSPSKADEYITDRVKQALTLVDIKVLDHILGGFCSVTTAFKMYQRLGFRRINREDRIQLPDSDTIRRFSADWHIWISEYVSN
jgi:hypothetical protein